MQIRRLIELLEEDAGDYGDDAQVMIQYQPSYPLKAKIAGLATAHDIEMRNVEDARTEYGDGCRSDEIEWPNPEPRVYIVATHDAGYNENPYGDRTAWEVARS